MSVRNTVGSDAVVLMSPGVQVVHIERGDHGGSGGERPASRGRGLPARRGLRRRLAAAAGVSAAAAAAPAASLRAPRRRSDNNYTPTTNTTRD